MQFAARAVEESIQDNPGLEKEGLQRLHFDLRSGPVKKGINQWWKILVGWFVFQVVAAVALITSSRLAECRL